DLGRDGLRDRDVRPGGDFVESGHADLPPVRGYGTRNSWPGVDHSVSAPRSQSSMDGAGRGAPPAAAARDPGAGAAGVVLNRGFASMAAAIAALIFAVSLGSIPAIASVNVRESSSADT